MPVPVSLDEWAPLLFETMVFGGPFDQEMARYSTWDEAEAGHKKMVKRIKAGGEYARLALAKLSTRQW